MIRQVYHTIKIQRDTKVALAIVVGVVLAAALVGVGIGYCIAVHFWG